MTSSLQRASFGVASNGATVEQITLDNGHGIVVRVLTRGAVLQSIVTPDREGLMDDIVLGYDTIDAYERDTAYFGAVVGRYANRIANARFTLLGREYHLAANNGENHLHGGPDGFHAQVWSAESLHEGNDVGVLLSLDVPDGHEGYPGRLHVQTRYTLTTTGELICEYRATTDKATPINITQHSYWNLGGHDSGDVLDHELMLAASRFTPVDSSLIPTGELRNVAGTPFDFRNARTVGASIDDDDEQLVIGKGYDHNFVLDGRMLAARLHDPRSGRTLEIETSEPGVQFYSGNVIPDGLEGKDGAQYFQHSGLCLETQHFPDAPNHPEFPSTILRPDMVFESRTVFRFGIAR